MCNLYRQANSADEVANWFKATNAAQSANFGEQIFPGQPGLVIASGNVRSMVWGFPLTLKSKRTGEPLKPKPVNNARSEKLENFMWRRSFEERRCLIPITAWAEAVGPKGSKTRTWLRLQDAELFCVAGIWRSSDEWGDCYSMIMVNSIGEAAEVHNRMPVILTGANVARWVEASPNEAGELCAPAEVPLIVERTDERWTAR